MVEERRQLMWKRMCRPKEGTDKKPGKSKKGWNAPIYKLLLHNDSFNRCTFAARRRLLLPWGHQR